MQYNPIFFMVGSIFSFLASVMAFLITYDEYTHHYQDKKMPRKLATETAIVTFVLFATISFLLGFLLKF